jgi:hypothetical protein
MTAIFLRFGRSGRHGREMGAKKSFVSDGSGEEDRAGMNLKCNRGAAENAETDADKKNLNDEINSNACSPRRVTN